tara:strand:- start:89 stop:526 length:438 start_codon:yes stop_codon:yes gene_type:complete
MNLNENKFPKVGVGVIVIRDGLVLLGKRKGAHGEGCWSFPGGHLEFNELLSECAKREVKEETDLDIEKIDQLTFTNDIFNKDDKHYATLYVLARSVVGDVKLMEPEKCEEWKWFDWGNLPDPLFIPIQNLLKQGFDLNKYIGEVR